MFHTIGSWIALPAMLLACFGYARLIRAGRTRWRHHLENRGAAERTQFVQDMNSRESLPALLGEAVARYREKRRGLRIAACLAAGVSLLTMGVFALGHASATAWFLLVNLLIAIAAPVLRRQTVRLTQAQNRVHHLTTLCYGTKDKGNISPLIAAIRLGNPTLAQAAKETLVALLPSLDSSDSRLLTEQDHILLNQALRGYHTEFVMAILQAYEQVGDLRAMPAVRKLKRCPSWVTGSEKIRVEASLCLLSLVEQRNELTLRGTPGNERIQQR